MAPRLESFALAAGEGQTHGVLVIGASPEAENELTQLKDRLVDGVYWNDDNNGALIADGVAERIGGSNWGYRSALESRLSGRKRCWKVCCDGTPTFRFTGTQ